jgi:hypothetical protein
MRRAALRGLLLLTAAGFAGSDVHAQANEGQYGPISVVDSLRLIRAARADQASFERVRRNHLPETWGSGGGYCDERIGRFCLTYGSGPTERIRPPEHRRIIEERAILADILNRAAQFLPGDDWIAGQRVRYLVEMRRLDEALTAAEGCRGERSWCAALAGYVHHYSGRPMEADSAFDVALANLAEMERGRWMDLSLILDHRSVRTYRRLRGAEREAFEERFWRLADPLLTRPGNELRSEHLARHVWDQLQYRAQSPDGLPWGWDLREILIRYGWPSHWSRVRDRMPAVGGGSPVLIGHYSSSPQYLLPPSPALLRETGTDGTWEVEEPRARTGYNIPLGDSIARWFSPLPHQVAVFRRGDSVHVVAGYELPADSVPADATVLAGLALLPTLEATARPDVVIDDGGGVRGAVIGTTAARPVLMSLELVVPDERRLARARYGLDLEALAAGELAVSDLLLLRDTGTLPDSLADAVGQARGSTRVHPGDGIGLFWEVYGLDVEATPEIDLSLRLLQGRPGWLRRMAERAGLLREVSPIRLRWREPATGPVLARSVRLEVPTVPPGTYLLELTVEAPGHDPIPVRREIEVESR